MAIAATASSSTAATKRLDYIQLDIVEHNRESYSRYRTAATDVIGATTAGGTKGIATVPHQSLHD